LSLFTHARYTEGFRIVLQCSASIASCLLCCPTAQAVLFSIETMGTASSDWRQAF